MNQQKIIKKIEKFIKQRNEPYTNFYIGLCDHPHKMHMIYSFEADNHETAKNTKDHFINLGVNQDEGETGKNPKHVYVYPLEYRYK